MVLLREDEVTSNISLEEQQNGQLLHYYEDL